MTFVHIVNVNNANAAACICTCHHCIEFNVNCIFMVMILLIVLFCNKWFQELVELIRTKKLAQAAAASAKKN